LYHFLYKGEGYGEVKTMNQKYNWNLAEEYFICSGHGSGVTLKDVSNKYSIPYQTVRRYAAVNQWHNKRLKKWVIEREMERTARR